MEIIDNLGFFSVIYIFFIFFVYICIIVIKFLLKLWVLMVVRYLKKYLGIYVMVMEEKILLRKL